MKKSLRNVALVLSLSLLSLAALAGVASAAHVGCGQVITESTVLDADVGPCTGTGLVVGADGVTLDLGGHRVFGVVGASGEGAGILLDGRTGVSVKNGSVTDFDAGIAVLGGGANKISGITARDNIGSGALGDFGDGIAVSGSNNNVLIGNTVAHNGPFDGIGLFSGSSNNTINKNAIVDNNVASFGMQDIGLRLEPGSVGNSVTNNEVKRNGLDGITVFGGSTDNVVKHNVIEANGIHAFPHRQGSGVAVAPTADRTLVQDNTVTGNGGHGLRIASQSNQVLTNKTGGNGVGLPLAVGPGAEPYYDLTDTNTTPPCDANVWSGNTFVTFNQPCVTA